MPTAEGKCSAFVPYTYTSSSQIKWLSGLLDQASEATCGKQAGEARTVSSEDSVTGGTQSPTLTTTPTSHLRVVPAATGCWYLGWSYPPQRAAPPSFCLARAVADSVLRGLSSLCGTNVAQYHAQIQLPRLAAECRISKYLSKS